MNTTKWQPPVDVPADVVKHMRERAHASAFLGSMLDLIRRNGGLTQNQLDMVLSEISR